MAGKMFPTPVSCLWPHILSLWNPLTLTWEEAKQEDYEGDPGGLRSREKPWQDQQGQQQVTRTCMLLPHRGLALGCRTTHAKQVYLA